MIRVAYDAEHPDLQNCPCGCIRAEELIVINPVLFYKMRKFDQKFWLLHEEGHIKLDTDDEVQADAYAFDAVVGTEYRSLKQMVAALDALLVNISPEVARRKKELYNKALNWDASHPQ